MSDDQTTELRERVLSAAEAGTPLSIQGSGSKSFLGRAATGTPLDVTAHAGIVNYQPKELVVTARCGTTLEEVEAALAEQGQALPFEPPHFGPGATIGGTIACGLSGPARPYLGAARDLVLGTRVLNGRGEVLRFGGEVMKNVAGYDVSRVMTGALGTLEEVEAALAEQGQALPFEPPHFGPGATIGGTIACGLSGPARPYLGAARDLVLGTRVLNGRGEVLRFGGEVMKNVAGYDVSRVMTGALGTLGLLLDVSIKVLPTPASSRTVSQERTPGEALELMNRWAGRPLPVTATCYDGERLYVRLSGAETAVAQAARDIGGEPLEHAEIFWRDKIREQGHAFFAGDVPLWRLSVPQSAPPLELPGKQLVEWGGAQRWLRSDASAETIRAVASRAGGHAGLFRCGDRTGDVFHPLPDALMSLHRNLKRAFDPKGILNPGRMYGAL